MTLYIWQFNIAYNYFLAKMFFFIYSFCTILVSKIKVTYLLVAFIIVLVVWKQPSWLVYEKLQYMQCFTKRWAKFQKGKQVKYGGIGPLSRYREILRKLDLVSQITGRDRQCSGFVCWICIQSWLIKPKDHLRVKLC